MNDFYIAHSFLSFPLLECTSYSTVLRYGKISHQKSYTSIEAAEICSAQEKEDSIEKCG